MYRTVLLSVVFGPSNLPGYVSVGSRIPMCDHLIVANGTDEYYSFHEHDLLRFKNPELETNPDNIRFAPSLAAEPAGILQEEDVMEVSVEEIQDTLVFS